ncbi:MAG: hypothetical protein DMF90_25220, partial [Acidobacteria bacterium]
MLTSLAARRPLGVQPPEVARGTAANHPPANAPFGAAFLFFFTPRAPAASPRHTIYGHAIGIACGYGALWLFGLQYAPPAMPTGVSAARVGAAALSLAS